MSIPKGVIKEIEFESSELNETLTLLLYLPACYSPFINYSLVIAQDGKDYFQLGRLARYADELIDEGEIDNIIAVGVPYKSVKDRRNKYHPQGKEHHAYIRFLANELVPWLDREYSLSKESKSRALMGDSLAATVSLLAALKYPNMFGKVILHSPYVNKSVLDAVDKHESPHLLDVYHVIGDKEFNVEVSDIKDFLTPNRNLHRLFVKKGFHLFYEEFAGGHSWKYWQSDVKRALQKMFP